MFNWIEIGDGDLVCLENGTRIYVHKETVTKYALMLSCFGGG